MFELAARLPVEDADDRVEVFDPARRRIFSFVGHVSRSRPHDVPDPGAFPRSVWSLGLADEPAAPREEASVPDALPFGSYWGRAALSDDGRHIYLTGSFGGVTALVAELGPDGVIAAWRDVTSLPPSPNGRRSLHQVLVARGRLYTLGGWYADGQPALRDVHAAAIAPDGSLDAFEAQSTTLPVEALGFSVARCGGRVLVARGTEIWAAAIDADGALGDFTLLVADDQLDHESYGGTAMACNDTTLVIADAGAVHVFELTAGAAPVRLARLAPPVPLPRRSVFVDGDRFVITSTAEGRIFAVAR